MVVFPNAKINIGLNVISKRPDGFHNLETVFYPVQWSDILEIIPSTEKTSFQSTGLFISNDTESNLCIKAYYLLKNRFKLPEVKIHLHKIIPMGAGLGGGSSDGVFVLKILNSLFDLNLNDEPLAGLALTLGSDCPFFVFNKPVFASGRGEIIHDVDLRLNGYWIVVIKPGIHVSTADAFKDIKPRIPEKSLIDLIRKPIEDWKNLIVNDFENAIFIKFPEIKTLKEKLYETGAVYASMSGSGSAVYGIFNNEPDLDKFKAETSIWKGQLL